MSSKPPAWPDQPDYDKLTLEVWTNGAVLPPDAVGLAAKLLKDHMNIFINFEEEIEADGRGEEAALCCAMTISTARSKSWS